MEISKIRGSSFKSFNKPTGRVVAMYPRWLARKAKRWQKWAFQYAIWESERYRDTCSRDSVCVCVFCERLQ